MGFSLEGSARLEHYRVRHHKDNGRCSECPATPKDRMALSIQCSGVGAYLELCSALAAPQYYAQWLQRPHQIVMKGAAASAQALNGENSRRITIGRAIGRRSTVNVTTESRQCAARLRAAKSASEAVPRAA